MRGWHQVSLGGGAGVTIGKGKADAGLTTGPCFLLLLLPKPPSPSSDQTDAENILSVSLQSLGRW